MIKFFIVTLKIFIIIQFNIPVFGQVFENKSKKDTLLFTFTSNKLKLNVIKKEVNFTKLYSSSEVYNYYLKHPELTSTKHSSLSIPLGNTCFLITKSENNSLNSTEKGVIIGLLYGLESIATYSKTHWLADIDSCNNNYHFLLSMVKEDMVLLSILKIDFANYYGQYPEFFDNLNIENWPKPSKISNEIKINIKDYFQELNHLESYVQKDKILLCIQNKEMLCDSKYFTYNTSSNEWFTLSFINDLIQSNNVELRDDLYKKSIDVVIKDSTFKSILLKLKKSELKDTVNINIENIKVIKEPKAFLILFNNNKLSDYNFLRYNFEEKKWYKVKFREIPINSNSK